MVTCWSSQWVQPCVQNAKPQAPMPPLDACRESIGCAVHGGECTRCSSHDGLGRKRGPERGQPARGVCMLHARCGCEVALICVLLLAERGVLILSAVWKPCDRGVYVYV